MTPEEAKKAAKKAERECLELEFAAHCRMYGLTPERQFKIQHVPYIYDFAFPACMLVIEINGGTWKKGGHSTGKGIQRDYRKSNAATMRDWHQLTFTAEDVHSGIAIRDVRQFLATHPPF